MSKPTARICAMLSERLQKMRRRTSSGLAHTSSAQAGWSSLSGGGGGGPMLARRPGAACKAPAVSARSMTATHGGGTHCNRIARE